MDDAESAIRHLGDEHRFVAEAQGHVGYVEYEDKPGVMVITHTIVPAAIGGRGIASRLVQAAIDFARNEGLKVEPRCSYAEAWMRKHPDAEDLRA